jgi:very-short-patch-repair endonuclease
MFDICSSFTSPIAVAMAGGGPRAAERVVEGKASRAMEQRTLITNRARRLRKAMSSPEVMLWTRLRGRNPDRPTFRRQHPLGSIILDFHCPSARLAVEVDGTTHWDEEAQRRDRMRDLWLERQGVTVVRVDAAAVYRNAGGVAAAILERARELRRSR